MSAKELAETLQSLEAKRGQERAALDQLFSSAGQLLVPEAIAWITAQVEDAVKTHHDVTQSLGLEGLQKLKADLKTLKEQIPSLVEQELGTPSDWPHRSSRLESLKHLPEAHKRSSNYLSESFRNVISYVGSILDRYGLLKERTGYYPSWKREAGRIRYSIGLTFTKDTEAAIGKYNKALTDLRKLDDQIERTSKQLEVERAKELWDQA